jgi:hypothetical protein
MRAATRPGPSTTLGMTGCAAALVSGAKSGGVPDVTDTSDAMRAATRPGPSTTLGMTGCAAALVNGGESDGMAAALQIAARYGGHAVDSCFCLSISSGVGQNQ